MLSCLPSARRPCIPRSHRFARSRPLTLCEGGVDFPSHSHPSPSLQRKGVRVMLSCLPSARRPCIPRSHRYARSRPLTLCEGGVDFPPPSHPSPSLQRKGTRSEANAGDANPRHSREGGNPRRGNPCGCPPFSRSKPPILPLSEGELKGVPAKQDGKGFTRAAHLNPLVFPL